jgi:hypothetical protein
MEIPNLVREHLGGEAIEATVSLGDEDVVCVTPSRALVYRGEGLLSDESVEEYALDVERFDLSHGRRKTKFVFEHVDGTETFTVPGSRADSLLTLLLQAILRVDGVIGGDESVAGVYQFSELTLVVAESRLIKHIGSTVWDEDFEVYHYDDVSGLEFEEGSVATQIVITVDGRPQRIKAPNDDAPQVEQTLVQALSTYHDVASLEQLTRTLAESQPPEAADTDGTASPSQSSSDDLGLEDGISPLVGDNSGSAEEAPHDAGQPPRPDDPAGSTASAETTQSASMNRSNTEAESSPSTQSESARQAGADTTTTPSASHIDPEDIEEMQEQLAALTEVVKRQNELLEQQDDRIQTHDERIEQLIDELRRGR